MLGKDEKNIKALLLAFSTILKDNIMQKLGCILSDSKT